MFYIRYLIFAVFTLCYSTDSKSQDVSFVVLGDLHYDRFDYHDWDYVMTRPQDFAQISEEYPKYTAIYLEKFLHRIKNQTLSHSPEVKGVVQLGDLVQGVAGTHALARQMNRGVVDFLYSIDLKIPWILVKGNHDVSNSPGQPEAWQEIIRPFIEGQIKKRIGNGMYTYKLSDDVELFVLDQFFSNDENLPESAMISFLENELNNSTATYKFVLTHQPVIPITERCWHLLSGIRRPVSDSTQRTKFLNLLGKHKVMVFCAHLHQYSVLSRQTPYGPVVQIMINSVNKGFDIIPPERIETNYLGEQWVTNNHEWQPHNKNIRHKILEEEKKHIKSFKKADIPGYGVISIRPDEHDVIMKFYNGFSSKPYEEINLTELQQ